MTASSRGGRAILGWIQSPRGSRLCSECIFRKFIQPSMGSRAYAVAASALISLSEPPIEQPTISKLSPITSPSTPTHYSIHTSLLIARAPLLTKIPTPFESAYYLYQKRLNERLALPFTRYFYFKPKTPKLATWKTEVKERQGVVARDTGLYNAYAKDGKGGWNDEVLVGDKTAREERKSITGWDHESENDEGTEERDFLVDGRRKTQADISRDTSRLDRQGGRTLYLVMRKGDDPWTFPTGELVGRESLHQSAVRILADSAGVNMNLWFVGNAPICHQVTEPFYVDRESRTEVQTPGKRTFFMRVKIIGGQVDLSVNTLGLSAFQWLTKSELKQILHPRLYGAVSNVLVDR